MPRDFRIDFTAAHRDQTGLAEVVRRCGDDRVADGFAQSGEGGGEGLGQRGVDPEIGNSGVGALKVDRHLNAAAGNGGEHGLADAGVKLVELAGCLHDDFRLFAIDGADFHGRLPHGCRRRAAAESCH